MTRCLSSGLITDKVVIGDWNGDGVDKVGVYRDGSSAGVGSSLYAPGTALFSLDTNGNLQYDAGDDVFLFGLSTDQFVTGNWVVTPPLQSVGTPQMAEFAAGGMGPGNVAALTNAELQPVLQQAIDNWAAAGANVSALQNANVQIGTLNDNLIGWTSGNTITLDPTADGWGWYTGGAQDANVFTVAGSDGMQAAAGSPAAGKMDLFTVLEHELGHELGLSDVNPVLYPSDLMASTLPTGVRRPPTTQDLDALFASPGSPRS